MTVTRPGTPTVAALVDAVTELQREDRLAPVTIAVPSGYAGLSLRRALAARSGFANVHFVVLERVAELLGAPALDPRRRPLPHALATEATRLALASVDAPGLPPSRRTVEAVTATLREARRSGVALTGALATVASTRRSLLPDRYDEEDLFEAAAGVVAQGAGGLDDLGTVVWYLPTRVTPGSRALVCALAAAGRLRVIAAATGDALADAALADVARALGDALPTTAAAGPPTATAVLVAPDRDTEVRAVTGAILERAANGMPFHRMGVTFAMEAPYLRLLHERLAAADVPVAGPASRRLAETAAGRVALALVHALDHDLARGEVIDVLAAAPLRPDVGDAARVAAWDRCSRRAGIVGGAEDWASLVGERWRDARSEDEEHEAATLLDLVDRLIPPDATWEGCCDHVASVLEALIGDARHLGEAEALARQQLGQVLAGLAPLAALGGDPPAFVAALRAELDAPFGPPRPTGTGVLVAPPEALAGSELDVVYVVGLGEDALGNATGDDPLLPGHGLVQHRRARRRAAFLTALAAAPARVVSFPRADLRAERGVMPGTWILESAAALAGRPVSAEELLAPQADAPWLTTVASLESLVTDDPPGPDEARLAALARRQAEDATPAGPLLDDVSLDDDLRRGLEAIRARRATHTTRWDGAVGPLERLAPDDEHPLSATRLEVYARCPFRYFLRSVLGVEETERPEALDRIDPRRRGSLVHDALHEMLTAHVGKPPDEPWSEAEHAELRAILERRIDALATRGPGGRPTLWAVERRHLLAAGRTFLDVDQRMRASRGVSPWLLEVGFGDGDDDELAPLDLRIGERRIRLRGRIDRLDRSPDGTRTEVFDYKTGRSTKGVLASDPVARGTLLQPVIYALVARREAPQAAVGTHYWYTNATAIETFDSLDDVDDRAESRVRDVLATMHDGIATGRFPRDPGKDNALFGPEHCQFCDHARACPQDRVRTTALRWDEDPAYEPLRHLHEEPT